MGASGDNHAPPPYQYKRAQVFRNLDVVPRGVSFLYPVHHSQGLGGEGISNDKNDDA